MKWFLYCLKNFATFKGRASRPEFWWCYFVVAIVGVGLHLVTRSFDPQLQGGIMGLWTLVIALPLTAVISRRLHDSGHSLWIIGGGAALLIACAFVMAEHKGALGNSVIGVFYAAELLWWAVLIYLLCRPSDAGPNRYGEPPPTSPS